MRRFLLSMLVVGIFVWVNPLVFGELSTWEEHWVDGSGNPTQRDITPSLDDTGWYYFGGGYFPVQNDMPVAAPDGDGWSLRFASVSGKYAIRRINDDGVAVTDAFRISFKYLGIGGSPSAQVVDSIDFYSIPGAAFATGIVFRASGSYTEVNCGAATQNVPTGQWVKVEMLIDPVSSETSYWLDGSFIGTSSWYGATGHGLDRIYLRGWAGGDGGGKRQWIDDISVNSVLDCGEPGDPYLAGDLTGSGPQGLPDCYVDLLDFAVLANQWLTCSDPANAECTNGWYW